MKTKLLSALKAAGIAFVGALGGAAFIPELLVELLKYLPF